MLFDDFPLPFLFLLSKISKAKIDAITCAQALIKDGKMPVEMLLSDEMYLQKCKEYFGELTSSDENGEIIKELSAL